MSREISRYSQRSDVVIESINGEEYDMSLRNLDEYHAHLQALQKEKGDCLHKAPRFVNEVHGLSVVLGMDLWKSVGEVHPIFLESSPGQIKKNITNKTHAGLLWTIKTLKDENILRIQKNCKMLEQIWLNSRT